METFIEYFIKRKSYSQNPLLGAKEFIKQAEIWGIKVDPTILESLEKQGLLVPVFRYVPEERVIQYIVFKKDNKEFRKRKGSTLEENEEYLREHEETYLSSLGDDKEWELSYESGRLYEPLEKGYESWDSFTKDGGIRKILYYSNFQLFLLHLIQSQIEYKLGTFVEDIYIPKKEGVEKVVDENKSMAIKRSQRFVNFLKFLLLSQSAFYPYASSGGRRITISGDDKLWSDLKSSYDYAEILKFLGLKDKDIMFWYKLFVEKAEDNLGGISANNKDWLQLWKNISWEKKKALKGSIKVGVDCLQWAIMIKKVVETSLKREIPDVDEISNYGFEDILKINLKQWGGAWNLRHIRNWRNVGLTKQEYDELNEINSSLQKGERKGSIQERFKKFQKKGFSIDWQKKVINFDDEESEIKNYYKDRYLQSYYQANSFGLDYQARVIMFVEGRSEEVVIPELMKWYYSVPSEIGIDIIPINGVTGWFESEFKIKDMQDKKAKRKLISNFNALLTYNLNKWQILPYLVVDNENNLMKLLNEGLSLKVDEDSLNLKSDSKLVYIWGESNNNFPFKGSNFEFANFTNEELVYGIRKYLLSKKSKTKGVTLKAMQELRELGAGIETIAQKRYESIINKPRLVSNLFSKLRNDHETGKIGKEVFDRPIFKMFDIVINHANLNHQPKDWITQITNRSIIKELVTGKRK